jgi:hypothetical protein
MATASSDRITVRTAASCPRAREPGADPVPTPGRPYEMAAGLASAPALSSSERTDPPDIQLIRTGGLVRLFECAFVSIHLPQSHFNDLSA